MLRFFGLLLGYFLLSTTIVHAGDNPVLVVNAPKQAVAGSTFVVNVEVSNAEMQGIARFMQVLPYGVTIEPAECANSDFEFANQTLKLMWFSLQKTNSLKFSYKVVTHANIKGSLNLSGSFVFINSSNIHTTATGNDVVVEITPAPNVSPANVVDIKNFKSKPTPESNLTFIPATQQMESLKMPSKALRQVSYDAKTDTYLVSILLDKGKANKYAKLEETIPQGYTAESVETRGGVFDFSNGKVKFLWLDLPSQPRFLVSYRLKPKAKQADGKALSITGYFAFMVADATEIHEVAQAQVDLKKFAITSDVRTKGRATTAGGAREIPIKYVGIAKQPQQAKKAETTAKVQEAQKQQAKTPTTAPLKANTKAAEAAPTKQETSKQEAPKQEASETKAKAGVAFKVQLAAVSKEADKAGAANRFKTDSPLLREEINGMVRYLVGPFTTYNEALAAKNKAKQSGYKDAFLVAYNQQGSRISIKEALASDKK
ncbi:SPOR domain-containing protein [uncultured Acetobacteroides sp.]|uniref:SPOR domain-containing protein n=1 Tax=uncultured Acetobacteroides sp. TaxID=1760811 RepID=UPI0029F477A5|nr:SPOR domain-containing protein [uncultured Acetobacteroides sp.]